MSLCTFYNGSHHYNHIICISPATLKVKLIVNTPCKDRKELERIETEYIIEYSEKYGDKLLNKRCNLYVRKKGTKHYFEIEDETKLRIRAGLEKKIKD